MKNIPLLLIFSIICLQLQCAEVRPQIRTDQNPPTQPPEQNKDNTQTDTQQKITTTQQSKFNIKDAFSNLQLPKPDINIDVKGAIDSAKSVLPDITIEIPKIDVDTEQIKGKLVWIKDKGLEMLGYAGVGALVGALLPVLLFLSLFALGFAIAGVRAGSLAACCQSPSVIAGGCFSTLQSFGATARFLIIIPKTCLIGAVSGIIFFIYCQITSYSIDINPDQLLQSLNTAKQTTLNALIDIGMGIVFGVLVPIGLFLLAISGEFIVNSFNICCSSPTSIFGIIKIIRKLRTCILMIPNAGILGAFSGLGYYLFVQ